MSLSPDQIRLIARLARIALREGESGAVGERLNRVLAMLDQLKAVDTEGIEPMSHALDAQLPQGQRLRPDAVTESDQRGLFQAGAPALEDGLYLVPKVIE
jgi:aspartyl-tRNA(Asn)/glutamyl-tRNA(Gln) amidotransferase subunit C